MWKVKFFLIILLFFVNCIRADDDEEICDHDEGFNCTNGFSIDCLDVCNGKRDCPDGSDEFLWNDVRESPCRNQECPNDHVRCNYGACIPIAGQCDNNFDCADKSDEWKYYCNIHKENPEEYKSCESGDFIPKHKFCNGKFDCPRDRSDEWPHLCKLWPCPLDTHYRCDSGGCIPLTKKCNNIKDCHDNSDEKYCSRNVKINPVSTTPSQGCLIRPDPNYYIKNELENYIINPGDRVPVNTRIIIKCRNNFVFHGNYSEQRRVCERYGRWNSPLPHCIKYCDARILNNSKSTTALCSFQGSKVDCNKIIPDTIAKVSCADSYKMPEQLGDSASYEMTCKTGGIWGNRKVNCVPICGRYATDNTSVAPWHVGVKTLNERCGGTIVSPSIVITALHCVQFEDDPALSVDKVEVIIAGNSVNVSEIIVGGQIDVALLKLREILTLSKSIRPICRTESVYIANSAKGFLHGWPKDTNKVTDVFYKTELDVLPRHNCGANLNGTYICVRPAYKLDRNETLCEGDSGSGIIAESDGVNYIIGLLSFKPGRNVKCTNEPIVATMFNQIPESLNTRINSDKEPLYDMDVFMNM